MAEIPSISTSELVARRRKLRSQRRLRVLQGCWQAVMVSGITAGLMWVVAQPDWMLRSPEQVLVEGNKSLAPETIRGLLPIHYPQFLLTLQPQAIVHYLESQAPIAEATVTRRLFPPSLTVRIQERYPVAIVYEPAASSTASTPGRSSQLSSANLAPSFFLDEKGTIIPYEKYMALQGSRPLPTLKVIGIQDQHRTQWATLYQQIGRSPVKVLEIDWREPGNLILRTELGMVHFGAYGAHFPEQLQTLDRMRQLPKQVSLDQIAYINLRNPDTPLLEMVQTQRTIDPAAEDATSDLGFDPSTDPNRSPEPDQTTTDAVDTGLNPDASPGVELNANPDSNTDPNVGSNADPGLDPTR